MSLRTKEQLEELYAKSRERQAKKCKKRRRLSRFITLDIETAGMNGANAFDADEMYNKLRELLNGNERYERDNSVK